MINHFRTLLLNETTTTLAAVGLTPYGVYTDPTFGKCVLPADLQSLYGILFPSSSIKSKVFFTHAYMMLIKACGLTEAATILDPRLTYTLPAIDNYFTNRAISAGVPITTVRDDIYLRVFNYDFMPAKHDTTVERVLTVRQTSYAASVVIRDETVTPNVTWGSVADLNFNGDDISEVVTVYNVNNTNNKAFDFVIKDPGQYRLNGALDWEIRMTTPVNNLLQNVYNTAKMNSGLINSLWSKYQANPSASSYDSLWIQHFNTTYQLAGLIVGLVYRMNKIQGL